MKHPDRLFLDIKELIQAARSAAYRSVNTLQVLTNFEIGRLIIENEQRGKNGLNMGNRF